MSIDPRLMERRKTVAEDKAKRNITRLLKFLSIVVLAGAFVWLTFSPWLSVSRVTTTGIQQSDSHATLVDERVAAGTPMILINAADVEEALLEDPWVAEATVQLDWPDEVTVDVVERVPTAWVRTEGGWTRRASDGVALPSTPEPDDVMARIDMPEMADSTVVDSVDLLGSLEFAETLAGDLQKGTVITRREGEIWATVAGYQVRLGRSVDMADKALSLGALLATGIPEGSTVVLIAPTNPSVTTPDRTVEGAEDDESGSSDEADGQSDDQGAGNADS